MRGNGHPSAKFPLSFSLGFYVYDPISLPILFWPSQNWIPTNKFLSDLARIRGFFSIMKYIPVTQLMYKPICEYRVPIKLEANYFLFYPTHPDYTEIKVYPNLTVIDFHSGKFEY